jgi:hypothetical protein
MRKSTITKIWLAGMIAIAIGLVVSLIGAGGILCAGGTWTTGEDGGITGFVPRFDSTFWTLTVITILGGMVALVGGLVQLVAWVGALANSWQLADKLWFLLTLVLGLVGFGLVVMIAYIVAAPDSYDVAPGAAPVGGSAVPPSYQPSH